MTEGGDEGQAGQAVDTGPDQGGQDRRQRRDGKRKAEIGRHPLPATEPVETGIAISQNKGQTHPGGQRCREKV